MSPISRRQFLQISGATLGLAGMEEIAAPWNVFGRDPGSREAQIERIPTYCNICFWKCGAVAYRRDGRLWKIEGNPHDPLSSGRLCPRGTGGVGEAFNRSRLKRPLIRRFVRGEASWQEASWEEALDFIAKRMKQIRDEAGPESIALFSHGVGGTFFKHTMKAFGTPNIAAPSFAQCRGPREVGFRLTFGEGVGSPERTDIENSRCIVLIGSHLGENMHNTQVQEFARAIERGATVIVVDPRFSVAASKAKWYLPVRPGTDLALLLAWMNVLVSEERYDKAYVERYGFGFEHFKARIAGYTPEWAYAETGIPPGLIRKTAREMAANAPATLVHPGRHVTWYGNDTQRSRAIALLNALLGSWGRKGGFYVPSRMQIPRHPHPPYPKPKRGRVDREAGTYPFAEEMLSTGIRRATLTGSPYPVKGWIVYGTNLIHSLPNPEETVEAIRKLDLLVVIDIIPSEIAGWADVILPEANYLERYDDLNTPAFREPFVSLRQPVVSPPGDQKPNWWIARALAGKLGLEAFFPWKDIEEYLQTRLAGVGLSLEELKRRGVVRGKGGPRYFEEGAEARFPTRSGKIEFYSVPLEEAGFDPVPRYTRPPAPPAGYLRLLYGRSPVHSFSATQSNPILGDLKEENEVWIHTSVAAALGLRSGDRVRLRNQDGVESNAVAVRATERIRKDCVYLIHGFGHTSRMIPQTYGKGASDAHLITRYTIDPIMGGTGMNVNFVTIVREVA